MGAASARTKTMAYKYMLHVFCNECSVPHPAGMVIERDELIAADQSVGDIYDGREVPEQIVTMLENNFRCPNTGKTYVQKDNHQVFLVRMS
jgi:hypothetical protein